MNAIFKSVLTVSLVCSLAAAAESKPAAHSGLDCAKCHDGQFLGKFKAVQEKLGKDAVPGWDRVSEELPLNESIRLSLAAKCATCHPKQANDWASSGHAMTYARSFLNREHNRMEAPMDDCLRCHAMYFEGSMRDMIKPLNTRGPWQMVKAELGDHPSITCLSCHQVHHQVRLTAQSKLVAEPVTSKAGFYDRRAGRFFSADKLPHPKIHNGDQEAKISDDQRLRVCYQCHAPSSPHQSGTSDDRTLRGVHEGMSCLECHATHSLDTRSACAQCHPAVSSCGLDVLKMDTNARAKGSAHDVHNLTCKECHPSGVPKAAK